MEERTETSNVEQGKESGSLQSAVDALVMPFVGISLTTGGKQTFYFTKEQFRKVHVTHPAWLFPIFRRRKIMDERLRI